MHLKDFLIKLGKVRVKFSTYFDLLPIVTQTKYKDRVYLWESKDSKWLIRYCKSIDGISIDEPFKLMVKKEEDWSIPTGKYVFSSIKMTYKFLLKRIAKNSKYIKDNTHPLIIKAEKLIRRVRRA